MDHFVLLDSLPRGFRIPGDFADRFRYDAATRRLSFRGFMCKAEYDRLFLLSEDWSYRRKLEDLFRLCELPDASPPKKGLRKLFAALNPGW